MPVSVPPPQTTYHVKNLSGTKLGMSVGGEWIEVLPGQTLRMPTLHTEIARMVGIGKLGLV